MIKNIDRHRILILDFGSQYTQLLARRIREMGVYSELWPWDVAAESVQAFHPQGIILSGGPESATENNTPRAPNIIFTLGVPILGICYGMQTMAIQLGGAISNTHQGEFGYAQLALKNKNALIDNLEDFVNANNEPCLKVWMSHADKVTKLPEHFTCIASTETCPIAIMAHLKKHFYGVQFHPEVTHTIQGQSLLKRFVLQICQCEPLWTPRNIIDQTLSELKDQIGDDQVILGLSGGVDSAVTAILLHRAIGKNLTCVFVDNDLLRLNESQQVLNIFQDQFGLNIIHVSAANRFMNALKGIQDPEKKRKVIGRVFIDIFDEQAAKQDGVKWLAQGTIYTDLVESAASGTAKSHLIKSHHNVAGLPKEMKLGLIEPLKDLFKDEVRQLGLELGLPHAMLHRHPFPGPGLGVRVLGEVKQEYCDLLRQADAIFIQELQKAELYQKVSQAFAVFLPIRSVGVMGDGRKYEWVIALRAIETVDFMTAHWAELPYDLLGRVSNRIINEVKGISRVVYDISGKPPATIEWE
ncbi:glutamine-hydrolyzing GMP synthase [Candidatus Williamhamiltonella defendens]|uniref:glutamine-hydrolyzing GMP synthase n=1 Tax=Candidatus Williamhamiltonella defendens TaxID=138072 RepID=UPI00130DAC95|nr:glutamine-hydrolyzing GMP synthase [Candidatus Hamiltonella defensa]